ncbi:phage protein NinX family protein [Paraburkholderia caribensis]|uniref:phage protein NinX family protein n=1 Tax=Paraburkholderia caribensis TaxID=75105 RepID=UPI0028597261|nr:phage protein NinX family protein [Paraburkholderia caribensis]MDR6381772.1 hypothetical protein [Paraburkholderia caribensis]
MKVSELSGAMLDYWVAKIEFADCGCTPRIANWTDGERYCLYPGAQDGVEIYGGSRYCPSTDWSIAGPIIAREGIQISPPESPVHRNGGPLSGWGESGTWSATIFRKGPQKRTVMWHETSPLVAAMRMFVASRFGKEVPDAS